MKLQSSLSGWVALGAFVVIASVAAVNVTSAQTDDAAAPAAAAPAAAAPAAGDLTGAAQDGSGSAFDEALKGGDMKAAGQ